MYILYHFPISCSSAVKIVLEIIGVEHNTKTVNLFEGEQFNNEFLAMNPQGKLPVLVEGEHVLTQGESILIYLSQKYYDANLMPDLAKEEGVEALKWLNIIATNLHGHFSKIFHPEKVSSDPSTVKINAEEEVVKLLNIVAQRLEEHDFLGTDKPTLADFYFVVVLGWGQTLSFNLLERYPVFSRYKKRLQAAKPESETLQSL